MSDIERFVTIWGGDGMMPASNGYYVRYDDHRAEVERLTNELHRTRAYGSELCGLLRRTGRAAGRRRDAAKAEVDRLTKERDEAQAEVERLKEQVGALTVAVEQADEMKAHAEAAAAAEEAETDRVMSERDAAQAEVERLRANGQAILDSSRPTDEDIWREAFMRCVSEYVTGEKRVIIADAMLAEYRKRWPR